MAKPPADTASFVLRFTQKVFQAEDGQHDVQWRGVIQHVQGGDEKRFSDFEAATKFIQTKLTEMTVEATADKSPEEQKGILAKSLDIWKKVTEDAPKVVMETIKDPMKQVANIQSQIQEVGDNIGQRINERIDQATSEIEELRGPSKSDFKQLLDVVQQLSEQVRALNAKVDKLPKQQ
ncbi:MAG: hypothetical protein AAGJ82_02795 [Bacteroidota bacterium]